MNESDLFNLDNMLAAIYPWSFIAGLSGLLFWSLARDTKWAGVFRGLFFVGIALWAVALVAAPVELTQKAGIIVRDLLVLGVAGLAMAAARNNMITGIGILVAAGFFLQLSYLNILHNTFNLRNEAMADAEILVDVTGTDSQPLLDFARENHVEIRHSFNPNAVNETELDDYYTIDLPGKATRKEIDQFIKELYDHRLIDWAEPNEVIEISPLETEVIEGLAKVGLDGLVNDPEVEKQWGLGNLDVTSLYQTLLLKTVKPKKVALIAILDTGVDGKHEDLQQVYQSTKSEYDRDVQGHGTHVAGIAAAVSNNQIGIASFDPSHAFVKVTSVKVLSDRGMGTQETIIKGMIEAADLGADVISMSLGGRSNAEKEIAYEKAVQYCNKKGAIVVVAAGNSNSNAKSFAPAKVEGVIAVSAINRSNARAPFSNWVSDLKFGLAAPGDEIYSTFPQNQYRSFRGTSMACPHVSSIIGILKSLEPDLTTEDVYGLLNSTGLDSKQPRETGKIINPAQAVRMLLD